jgi:hypothetical protein
MDCWEVKQCNEKTYMNCPAYPDNGKDCWKVTGTLCDGGRIQKSSKQEKIAFCSTCDFYKTYANKF